jgi:hypothetical protein
MLDDGAGQFDEVGIRDGCGESRAASEVAADES